MSIARTYTSLRDPQAGAVFIEAAIVLPLLLIMVLLLFSYAQIAYKKTLAVIAIHEIARAGERAFATHDSMEQHLLQRLEGLGLRNTAVEAPDSEIEISSGVFAHTIRASFDIDCVTCNIISKFHNSLLHHELQTYYLRGQT